MGNSIQTPRCHANWIFNLLIVSFDNSVERDPQVFFIVIDAQARNMAKLIKYVIDVIKIGIIEPQWCTGVSTTCKQWVKVTQ